MRVGSTGVELNLNVGQEYLWECWKHFIQDVPPRIDVLVINGDAIDGQNVKEQGRTCPMSLPSSRPWQRAGR